MGIATSKPSMGGKVPKGAKSPVSGKNTKIVRVPGKGGGVKIPKTRAASGKHGSGYGKGR